MRALPFAWLLVASLQVPSTLRVGGTVSDEAARPDESTLLAEVLSNQHAVEAAREAYTYTMTVRDLERSSGTGATRTYEVFHVAGRQFRKLTAQDGRPLKPAEARAEEERVAKAVRRHRDRQSRREADEVGDDDLTPSDVLRLCRLANARREELRGQTVIVYDFEPRPGSRPRGRIESWMTRLGGRVWIDEQARRLLRLEARVTRPLRVAGGLVVSVQPGSSLVFEQTLVNGEVWLPSSAQVDVSARFLLLKGIAQHQEIRFSDYRKFSIETSEDVRSPEP